MAVRINPCFGCPIKAGCSLRDDFRKRVSGLGLRSATFRCSRIEDALAPGTRISIEHPFRAAGDNFYGDYNIVRHEVPATISSSSGHMFSCIVDRDVLVDLLENYEGSETDPDKVRFRKTMRHSRIVKFLDEPKRRLCDNGNPILPSGDCDQRSSDKWVCSFCSHNKKRLAEKAA